MASIAPLIAAGAATAGAVALLAATAPAPTVPAAPAPDFSHAGQPLNAALLASQDWIAHGTAGMDRSYYFGGDNHTLVGTGETEQYYDPAYCTSPAVPDAVVAGSVQYGGWSIIARPATAADRASCKMTANQKYLSALTTTQHSFSAVGGYWEAQMYFSAVPGSWPAFWMLPTTKTAANGGAVPEIDVMEEYAGILKGVDRTGRPIATVHLAGGASPSCGQTVTAKPNTWHTYGVLWEPTELIFYVDRAETCRILVKVTDSHYALVDEAMAGGTYTASKTYPVSAFQPAQLNVDWVRHYALQQPAKP